MQQSEGIPIATPPAFQWSDFNVFRTIETFPSVPSSIHHPPPRHLSQCYHSNMIEHETTLNSWNTIIAYWNRNAAAVSCLLLHFEVKLEFARVYTTKWLSYVSLISYNHHLMFVTSWRMPASGMWLLVWLVRTDYSEESLASFFRLENSAREEQR
jgi:hypothetical protein